MSMQPTWFGPPEQPLFGVWHLPADGSARSVAVLCSAIGHEQDVAHRPLRILAERLTAQGIAVLRFDYVGAGDSAGDHTTPNLVSKWITSITTAVTTARSAGATHVTLVGIRMGATLAASAMASGLEADTFVAWDPCPTGKAFLREERALRRLSLGTVPMANDDGSIEGSAVIYEPETVQALNAMTFADEITASATLILQRDDRPAPEQVVQLSTQPNTTLLAATEQAKLFDVADIAALTPSKTINEIVTWLAEQTPKTKAQLQIQISTTALLPTRWGNVRERICSVGSEQLFAIVTAAASEKEGWGRHAPDRQSEAGQGDDVPSATDRTDPLVTRRGELATSNPLMVFAPTATHYHVGVARIAVDVGRELAARGVDSVRFDPHGLGDSPDATTLDGPVYYTSDVTTGVELVARELRGDRAIAVLGLCSGAWAANMVIASLQPTAAYLLNPIVWGKRPPPMGPVERTEPSRLADAFNRVQGYPLLAKGGVAAWKTLATIGVVDSPSSELDKPDHRSSAITVLLGPEETEVFNRKAGFGSPQRLRSRSHVRFLNSPYDDHSLLTAINRREVMAQVVELALEDLAVTAPEPANQ